MRAFTVTDLSDYEGRSCVVFATSHGKAKWSAMGELDSDDYTSLRAHLSPEFDVYCPGPVSSADKVRAGWWCFCNGACGRRVEMLETGADATIEAVEGEDGEIYCKSCCPTGKPISAGVER